MAPILLGGADSKQRPALLETHVLPHKLLETFLLVLELRLKQLSLDLLLAY